MDMSIGFRSTAVIEGIPFAIIFAEGRDLGHGAWLCSV
jgi:hypothetical protein